MKNHLISLVLVIVAAVGAIGLFKIYNDKLTAGQKAPESIAGLKKLEEGGMPDLVIEGLQGDKKKLSDYYGKVILLNIWASWCPPCVTEFPSMVKLAKKFEKDMLVIAISQDTDRKDLESFLKQQGNLGANFYIGVDMEKKVPELLNLVALPETYILDRKGKLVRKISGVEDWYSPDAIKFFETLVK